MTPDSRNREPRERQTHAATLSGAPSGHGSNGNGHLTNGSTPALAHLQEELPSARPAVRGRSLFVGDTKFHVRGATYGTFADGGYPTPNVVALDFALMAANGFNTVRTYTVPPRWLLDLAHAHGLFVMVGIPWEQHIAFLDERSRRRAIVEKTREGVRACADHPAVLCYAVGNEIPTSIVRWYGRRRIERFVNRLCRAAKREDPEGLVTYVNYPSTEYLDLTAIDICCFNVFLETPTEYRAYLARLQNIAGDRPLILTELGLDSRRNGVEAQAQVVEWKVREAFASGAAGAFIFAWTDEWHRGGCEIDDWDFGLVDRERNPKPALEAARRVFGELPLRHDARWPSISVLVCAYNAEDTIRECLEAVGAVDYPRFEVIVVDDGSTDATAAIASEFDWVRVISTDNQGLSAARNLALQAATGEVVAYLDSDAFPDPHWLQYLATSFVDSNHAGIGGPNIVPPEDSWVAQCIAGSPGGPIHVLLSDQEAEHIPGCNMAFRKEHLEAVGGFDPQFRAAGDDVDVCWRILDMGWTLGYSPGAVVWHHPRDSVRTYFKQQYGYGKAEAQLERKWPDRYNDAGHLSWAGRVYGNGRKFGRRWRVYYGTWGAGLFQSLRERPPHAMRTLPMLPEWLLVIVALTALSSLALVWGALLPSVALLAVAIAAPVIDAGLNGKRTADARGLGSRRERIRLRGMLTALHLLQPVARLWGRLRHGLSPWRRHGCGGFRLPVPRRVDVWSEEWRAPEQWLERLEVAVTRCTPTRRGGAYDRWDLELRGGVFGALRMRLAVEEHGGGRQLVLSRLWPRMGWVAIFPAAVLGTLALLAGLDGASIASTALAAGAAAVLTLTVRAAGFAAATLVRALDELADDDSEEPADDWEPALPELVHRDLEPAATSPSPIALTQMSVSTARYRDDLKRP